MDIAQATKLINFYKYAYANSAPTSRDYYHKQADSVRTALGNMDFMKNAADLNWNPKNENWDDVMNTDYAKDLGMFGLGYSQATATQMANQMTGTTDTTTPNLNQKQDVVQMPTGTTPYNQPNLVTQPPQQPLTPPVDSAAADAFKAMQDASNAWVAKNNDPIAMAQANADSYTQMAMRAGNTKLQAQLAQANWTINNGGIWKTLQPEYQKQLDSALATLTQISSVARANVAAQKASMDAEQAMNYQNALDDLDRNLVASRQRTTEEMNQRGLFFSTVLDSVMGKVEAASATQRGQLGRQNIVELGKIAAQIAALTANVDIQELQGKAAAVAQYGAAMLRWIAQDEQTKQAAQALIAGLEVEQKGLYDTIGMEIFGTVQQIQAQGRQEATAQTEKDWTDWVAGIGQYENQPGGYQTEINNQQNILNDPNATPEQKTLAAKKITALQEARTGKVSNAFETWKATTNIYANDYQAAINQLDPNDPLYAQKKSYLIGLRMDKIVELAKTNADAAQQELDNAFKDRQISVQEYNATTARISATGSATGTTKNEAPGTTGTSGKFWTPEQARSFKTAYEKIIAMPIGTVIDANTAQSSTAGGVTLVEGTTWTAESKAAYLESNRRLYESSVDFINKNDPTGLNPNNPAIGVGLRAVLQGMMAQGIALTKENLREAIETYKKDLGGGYSADYGYFGAEYQTLMEEFNQLP